MKVLEKIVGIKCMQHLCEYFLKLTQHKKPQHNSSLKLDTCIQELMDRNLKL